MAPDAPDFSVVVPTRDRPRELLGCLDALAALDYPRDAFEVVVVDDGGREPAESAVEALRGRLHVVLLRQAHAGPAVARNQGAARARGRYLAFTDDDCRPDPLWLRALSDRLAAQPRAAVGGSTLNGLPANRFSSASQVILEIVQAHANPDPDRATFFASNNLALPAERFREIGGFDRGFRRAGSEDRDLCDRWLQRGYPLIHAPGAIVRHRHALDLAGFCRQHFDYGRGAYHFHRLRSRRGGARMQVQPRIHLEALRQPFRRARGLAALALLGTLALWQVANGAGFLSEWLVHRVSATDRRD